MFAPSGETLQWFTEPSLRWWRLDSHSGRFLRVNPRNMGIRALSGDERAHRWGSHSPAPGGPYGISIPMTFERITTTLHYRSQVTLRDSYPYDLNLRGRYVVVEMP